MRIPVSSVHDFPWTGGFINQYTNRGWGRAARAECGGEEDHNI
ncbi:hypothetical protein [Hungatella sp.]|nr:hypothetical protein [Hungatella sp.]